MSRNYLDFILEVASFQIRILVGGTAWNGLSHMEQDRGLLEEPRQILGTTHSQSIAMMQVVQPVMVEPILEPAEGSLVTHDAGAEHGLGRG